MARTDTLNNFLTDVASSIRTKTGETDLILASDFDTKIKNIPEATEPILQNKSIEITENGTNIIIPDVGYDGLNNVEITTNVSEIGGTPEIGFVVEEWDKDGYAIEVSIIGMKTIPRYAFYNIDTTGGSFLSAKIEKINLPESIETIGYRSFGGNATLKKVNIPSAVTSLSSGGEFYNAHALQQLSMNIITFNKNSIPWIGCTSLFGLWLGDKLTGSSFGYQTFNDISSSVKKIYFDLPRSIVETFQGYDQSFSNNKINASNIICNDDDEFITQDEFDAIDWSTYTE